MLSNPFLLGLSHCKYSLDVFGHRVWDRHWPRVCKNAKICGSPKIFPTATRVLWPLAIAGNTGGYALSLNQYPFPILKKRVGVFTQPRPLAEHRLRRARGARAL